MTTQSERDFTPYHITYDCNEYNAIKERPLGDDHRYWQWSADLKHIDKILDDKKIGLNKKMPYMWVLEIGTTGKYHYHCYFYSSKSKNTVKKYFFEHAKENLKVSDPDNLKYAKYGRDGVIGVEIYLHKGITNHMCKTDDLKVLPRKIIQNEDFYGDIKNETSRSYKIRKMYEKIIEDLKKYAKECRTINEENKLTEFQLILKDLEKKPTMEAHEIKSYMIDTHYMRPKYVYSENGFKRLFLKITREKNEKLYKQILKDSMNSIMSNAFKL